MLANPTSICYQESYPALEAAQYTGIGKYVLITNASQDIARSIAPSWARAGAAGIAICSRNAGDLGSVTAEIRVANPGVQVLAMVCDTTSLYEVARLFSNVKDNFERLDVIIANVGTAHLESTDEADDNDMWWTDTTTNFRSTHLPAHQYIRTYGPSPTGTFISIPSGAQTVVGPGVSSYQFAKQIDRRLIEFLVFEYPEMKAFSLDARQALDTYKLFEAVDPDLLGLFSVWLGGGRADALKGSCIHPSWDIDELEISIDERDISQRSAETRYEGIATTISTRTEGSTRT